MSPQATRHEVTFGPAGIDVPGINYTRTWDWPAAAAVPGKSISLSGWTGPSAVVRYDSGRKTTLLNLEQVTGSVYVRSLAPHIGSIGFEYYDRYENLLAITGEPQSFGITWQRYSITRTAPSKAASLIFRVDLSAANTYVRLAAPQVEAGASVSAWEPGGASPEVIIDQMPATTPRFPLRDVSISILEV